MKDLEEVAKAHMQTDAHRSVTPHNADPAVLYSLAHAKMYMYALVSVYVHVPVHEQATKTT